MAVCLRIILQCNVSLIRRDYKIICAFRDGNSSDDVEDLDLNSVGQAQEYSRRFSLGKCDFSISFSIVASYDVQIGQLTFGQFSNLIYAIIRVFFSHLSIDKM